MSDVAKLIDDYLRLRRSLGFKLEKDGRFLTQFHQYLQQQNITAVTVEVMVDWAILPGRTPQWHAARLGVLRGFARWANLFDSTIEVPPAGPHPGGVDGRGHQVRQDPSGSPAPDHGRGPGGLRPAARGDPGQVRTDALFVSSAGTRLIYKNVAFFFHRLVGKAGILPRSSRCRPRLHDLRHTFAVATMLDAYRQDRNPAEVLPILSTYLGHGSPGSTYWYLQADPHLVAAAAEHRSCMGDAAVGVIS